MKYIPKLTTVIFLGVFGIFAFTSAQEPPPLNQYQEQVNPQQNPYQEELQVTPPPPSPTEPQQKTIPPQQKPPSLQTPPSVEPQAISPETSLLPQAFDTNAVGAFNFSSPTSYVLIGGGFVFFFWLGWREWLKRKKETELPAEAEKIVCSTCGGSGKITKKRKMSAPCRHCKETGIDICHHCSGTGRNGLGIGVPLDDIENYPKCDYCFGKGFPEIPLRCCMCKGKRKEEYEESYEETCPTCKGSGWIRNW
ncbi:MAG: hypothetical protein AAB587_02565 [Patescibacteria group bacterium]